jgi:hypothetical protein
MLRIRSRLIEVLRKTKSSFEGAVSEVNVSYEKKWCKATLRLNRNNLYRWNNLSNDWITGELRNFLSKRKISSLSIFCLFSYIYISRMQISETRLALGEEFSRPRRLSM